VAGGRDANFPPAIFQDCIVRTTGEIFDPWGFLCRIIDTIGLAYFILSRD
jgi:hypothetical protein